MADEPLKFDASTLEGLAKLKAEQQSLRELSQRAADHREKVTEVYNRVVRDYEARIRGLEDQAQKLRLKLREEFAELDGRFAEARQALDQARFDLQESEFRKEIGEYTAEEFQRRQHAIEGAIAEKQGELQGLTRLRERFLELLPLEALTAPEVAAPAPVGVAHAAPHAAPPVVPLPTPQPIATPAAVAPPPVTPRSRPAPVPAAAAPPPAVAGIGETMVLPPPGSAVFKMPPLPADEGATQILSAGAADAGEPFGTVAIPVGALVEEKAGAAPITHRLGMLTTIGRTPDNQIVIPSREVSRKHAEVLLGQSGYVLRDLGSPNGTYVNGSKVTEHALRDGDKITLGGLTFVFKGK